MVAIQTLASQISAGVLAGGAGSRLGGVDKGLALLGGQPLVQRVLQALAPQVGECLISANRNAEIYAALGVRVVVDASGHGPLAGLAALLKAARHAWLLCVPCDAPTLPADLAARLLDAAQVHGRDAAVLHDGMYPHPTFCLVRTHLAASAQAAADASVGLSAWLTAQQAVHCFGDVPGNLNTPQDFALAEAAL